MTGIYKCEVCERSCLGLTQAKNCCIEIKIERLRAENKRLQARVAALEGAIHDLKDYWYADPYQSTWGVAIPRLFEALAATEQEGEG